MPKKKYPGSIGATVPKLMPHLVPKPLWGKSAAQLFKGKGRAVWKRIRSDALQVALNACQVCTEPGPDSTLNCHELWDYDDEHSTATLVGLRIQCRNCDCAVHMGRAEKHGFLDLALTCGGYVEAAYIGYPTGFWWNVLTSSFEEMAAEPIVANIPINAGGTVHDCKLVISGGKRKYGIIACDHGNAGHAWLDGAAKSAERLQSEYSTKRTAFVVREMQGGGLEVLPGTQVPLVVGDSVPEISKKLVAALQE